MENLIVGLVAVGADHLSLRGAAAPAKVLTGENPHMNTSGWLQLAFFSIVLLALTKPMGLYLVRVLDAKAGPSSIRS